MLLEHPLKPVEELIAGSIAVTFAAKVSPLRASAVAVTFDQYAIYLMGFEQSQNPLS